MVHRQKGKSMKRKRSWHHRGNGPDRAWARAVKMFRRSGVTPDKEGNTK